MNIFNKIYNTFFLCTSHFTKYYLQLNIRMKFIKIDIIWYLLDTLGQTK